MNDAYRYETFRAEPEHFNTKFTQYLNERHSEDWRVKDCSYCHDTSNQHMYASCLFERSS